MAAEVDSANTSLAAQTALAAFAKSRTHSDTHVSLHNLSLEKVAKAWDLRVACALVSLDMVDQFLRDVDIYPDDADAMRQAARDYLRAWPPAAPDGSYVEGPPDRLNPDEWFELAQNRYGQRTSEGISVLSERLAARPQRHDSWVELMGKLNVVIALGSGPDLDGDTFEWIREMAGEYLAESDQLRARLDKLERLRRSPWDSELLSTTFYPSDKRDDPDARFQPGPHLWRLLDDQQWQRFRKRLKSRLSAQDLEKLVSWAGRVGISGDRLRSAI